MNGGWGAVFPPRRLPAIDDRWAARLRPLWIIAFALAIVVQASGFVFAYRQSYGVNPAFTAIGLSSNTEDDGFVHVDPVGHRSRAAGIVDDSRILAIEHHPLPARIRASAIADRLRAVPGPLVHLTLQSPDGRIRQHALVRSPIHAAEEARGQFLPGPVRMAVRLGFAALTTLSLLASAALLFLRCPRELVAVMFSFSFIAMAMMVDPPIQMWLGLLIDDVINLLVMIWWPLVVVALAAFPDGRFEPRWMRWILVAAVPTGIVVALDETEGLPQLLLGVGLPVLLAAGQIVRYRRLGPGIARQQIKWATFGFVAGFTLIGLSLWLITQMGVETWSPPWQSVFYLAMVCLFSVGFALLPLGLLISLTRFRLWEADIVISRSAAYAFITIVVGAVWAGSADLVKSFVTSLLGDGNTMLATGLSALLAAGVFGPTQSIVLKWTKRRFVQGIGRLRELPARLTLWRNTETAPELGMRALGIIIDSVHADGAALLALNPTGRELVAARDVPAPERLASPGEEQPDRDFPVALELRDDEGPVGTLLLGPRSDGNRYNRTEREALEEVVQPLAEALRFVRSRVQRELGMQQMFAEMQQRLARLEGMPQPRAT